MKLSIAVMAHIDRATAAIELGDRLDADVVYDEHNHIWDTARRALLAYESDATHHMVIQDDAVLSGDVVQATAEIVDTHPTRFISLYLGAVKPVQKQVEKWVDAADETGATMIDASGPHWGVACVYPTDRIPAMVEWCDRYKNAGQQYDSRVLAWSRVVEETWLYAWPSLVDHDTTVPSLHSSTPDRRAVRFIGRNRSGVGSDWLNVQHTDPVSLHPPVRFVHTTTGRHRRVGKRTPGYDRLMRQGTWELVEGG